MIKQILLSALCIFLIKELSYSQSFQYRHCLKEVSFYGESGVDDYIRLKEDILETDIDPPHFVMEYPVGCFSFDLGILTDKKPVAYVSGTAPRILATFLTDCPSSLRIRGKVIIQGPLPVFEFPEKEVTPSNGKVEYKEANGDPVVANNVFQAGVVKYFDEFEIIWEISTDGSNWEEVGTSQNQLYVPKEFDPNIPDYYDPPYFHTVIHTSCEHANGKSSDADIITSIYAGFKDKMVTRIKGDHIMTYWDTGVENYELCTDFIQLIGLGNGTCQAWAEFFNACLAVQGVEGTKVTIEPDGEISIQDLWDYLDSNFSGQPFETGTNTTYFLVREWDNIPINSAIPLEGQTENEALYSPGSPGVTAQGWMNGKNGIIDNPRSIFDNHAGPAPYKSDKITDG